MCASFFPLKFTFVKKTFVPIALYDEFFLILVGNINKWDLKKIG